VIFEIKDFPVIIIWLFWPFFQIFGPVQSILKFSSLDEAIQRANSTTFGLGAGVLTNNINAAMKVANEVQAGTVW